MVFARDALPDYGGHRAEADSVLHTRAAAICERPARTQRSSSGSRKTKEHLGTLERRYATLIASDPRSNRDRCVPAGLRTAQGIFAGAAKLRDGVDDLKSAAHWHSLRARLSAQDSSKKYGERFEDSEGKQIFLGCGEREHCCYADPRYRAHRHASDCVRRRATPATRILIGTTHSTASDGMLRQALVCTRGSPWREDAGLTDHGLRSRAAPRVRLQQRWERPSRHQITAMTGDRDVRARLFLRSRVVGPPQLSRRTA